VAVRARLRWVTTLLAIALKLGVDALLGRGFDACSLCSMASGTFLGCTLVGGVMAVYRKPPGRPP
jgi:hypothetical protein